MKQEIIIWSICIAIMKLAQGEGLSSLHPAGTGFPAVIKLRQAYGVIFHKQPQVLINEYSHLKILFKVSLPTTTNFTRWKTPKKLCNGKGKNRECNQHGQLIEQIRHEYHRKLDDIIALQEQIKVLLQQPNENTPLNGRPTRGLMNFVGSFQKWAFGLMTEQDFSKIVQRINNIEQLQEERNEDIKDRKEDLLHFMNLSENKMETIAKKAQTNHEAITGIITAMNKLDTIIEEAENSFIEVQK
jgi:hypothetical protein